MNLLLGPEPAERDTKCRASARGWLRPDGLKAGTSVPSVILRLLAEESVSQKRFFTIVQNDKVGAGGQRDGATEKRKDPQRCL